MGKERRHAGRIILVLILLISVAQAGCAKQNSDTRLEEEQKTVAAGETAQDTASAQDTEDVDTVSFEAPGAKAEAEVASAAQTGSDAPADTASAETESSAAPSGDKSEAEKRKSVVDTVLRLHKPAPEVSLTDIDGESITLSDFEGRTVVLSLWDTSCDVCIEQMKTLQAEIEKHNADVAVIMVSPGKKMKENKDDPDPTEEEHEKARREAVEKVEESGLDADVAFDTEFRTIAAYRATGIPYNILIDADGNLQAAGRLLATQALKTMTFADMALKVAGGGDVPPCEFNVHETPEHYKKFLGGQVPDFKATDYNGAEQSPSFYKGFSRLLITMWSPTCGHCRAELPRLELFNREYAEENNIKLLGVVSLPSKEDAGKYEEVARKIIDVFDISFPMIPDYGQEIQSKFDIKGVPTAFLVGRDGKIKHVFSGQFMFTAEVLGCKIAEIEDN